MEADRKAVSRASLHACCLVLLALNALAGRMALSFQETGLVGGFAGLFGVSAIIWFALYALAMIGWQAGHGRSSSAGRLDFALMALAVAVAILPVPQLAAFALFGQSALLFITSAPASAERRIAVVALALCAPLLWGPLLLKLAGRELLGFDGWIVSIVSGYRQAGNMVIGPDSDHSVLIYQGCSSLRDISPVLVLMAVMSQFLRIPVGRSMVLAGLCAIAGVVLVNAVRIAAIAHHPEYYQWLHRGMGSVWFGWASLLVMLGCMGTGAMRAARNAR